MGIDVSTYQGTIDWERVKNAGNSFAFAKATEGIHTVDTTFAANWAGMQAAGISRGAYHFYRATRDPAQQAQHFLDVLTSAGGLTDTDLPPALDLEDNNGAAQIGSTALISGVTTWLSHVSDATGRIPIIYTAPSFWRTYMNNQFGQYFLWIANYGVPKPHVPDGWDRWSFWQYADNGNVDGIQGPVDLDHFAGTQADLPAFIASSKI